MFQLSLLLLEGGREGGREGGGLEMQEYLNILFINSCHLTLIHFNSANWFLMFDIYR